METVVVGAGVLGAALAHELARGGHAVTLVEPLVPGHVRSGSGGGSRLLRFSHGDDAFHVRLALRASVLWDELDPGLVVRCGVVWFAHREDGWEAASERALRAEGVAVERVDPVALFPSVRTDDLVFTLLELDAGVVRARRATGALARAAAAAGARIVAARARPEGAAVRLDDGRLLEGDRVVWACGGWLPALFGEELGLRVTQQDVLHFGAGRSWRTPGVPGWVDYDRAAYGAGDLDGHGVKVSPDAEGPPLDPESDDRAVLAGSLRRGRSELAHRFPDLADAPLVATEVCQYELTADTRFLAGPHPDHDGRVWILGGGSGHAFKHAPALAELVAGALPGLDPPDPRFAVVPRSPDRGLRTAGV